MKVALLVPGFSTSEQDWCIPSLLEFVRRMCRMVDLHVFAIRWPEHGHLYRVFDATVHATDGRKRLGWRVLDLWRRTLRGMTAEHRREPFDVIHAFWADEPGWLAVVAGRYLGVPVIISLSGGELISFPDIDYGLLRLPGRRPVVRWVLGQADTVTAGSRYLVEIARAHLPPARRDRLMLAPLGVDCTRFSRLVGPPKASNGPIMVNVGSLYPVKGQADLIEAFAEVGEGQLWIVGDGPLRGALTTLAARLRLSGRVRFLGELSHDSLASVYRSANLFVQASRHEAQGMALLEAAACGVPPVGTSVGILPEIGAAVRDRGELGGAINQLLNDAPRRHELARQAAAKVHRDLTVEATVEQFAALYDRARS
jgi:glycosyltransferase involved in cell wall biosynthesis